MTTVLAAPNLPPTATVADSNRLFVAAWGLLAGCGLIVLWVLWRVWMSLPEMNDRFLIPAAAGWLVYRNRPRFCAIPASPSLWGLALVGLGALMGPPAWFLLVQVGPRVLLLWWLVGALAFSAFGLSVVQFGWRRAWVNAFPIAFCFLALPMPERWQMPLQMRLKEYTTAATAAALPAVGIPAERRGHTLLLPSGQLGVVDACSGVRSVTALTAIALFVAYVRGFSVWRGALLVVLTLGIVVVSNSLRVIITGVLQERVSPAFVQGKAHDVLGYLVILIGLGLILAASSLLARGLKSSPRWPDATPSGVRPRGGLAALTLLAASVTGGIWAEQFRAGAAEPVDLAALPLSIGGWQGNDRPVPAEVTDILKSDQILHRIYVGELGHELAIYVMYWSPNSLAAMHHPDVCMPLQGWECGTSRTLLIPYRADRDPVPVCLRTYEQNGHRQLVFYWAQSGSALLPEGKEESSGAHEHQWVVEMLAGQVGPPQTARLSVRVDMEIIGDEERQARVLTEVTAAIMRDLYALLPWAAPSP